MNVFPSGGRAILDRLYAQHQDWAKGSDDDRRALTKMMAEQFAFTFGPRWGTKRAAGPQSKDTLALLLDDGAFDMWDWQNGSTKAIQVQDGAAPTFQHVADQVFLSVTPTNHLGMTPPPPPDDNDADGPINPTLLETLTALALQLQTIPQQAEAFRAEVRSLAEKVDEMARWQVRLMDAIVSIRERQEEGVTGALSYRLTLKPPAKTHGNGQE